MDSKSKTKKVRYNKKQEYEDNLFGPDEYYDQGPALAVQELAVRYLN